MIGAGTASIVNRMRGKVIVPACVVGAVILGGFALWHRAVSPAETRASPVPVLAATVQAHDVPIYRYGVGTVIADNIIHPADPAGLVGLTHIQPVSLIFTLPETTLTAIEQEMAKGPVKLFAYSQDDRTQLGAGTLLPIDNQTSPTTGMVRLRATFPNEKLLLRPGELVNVRLLLRTQHDGITVASQAVQQGPNGSYLYVVGPDQAVQVRPVTVGQVSQGQTLIESGLKDGETVVLGQSRLQPGAHVEMLHGRAAQKKTDPQNTIHTKGL